MLMIRWKWTKWEDETYISEKKHVKYNDFQLHTNCKSLTPVYKNLRRTSTCKLPILDTVGEIVINHEALILHNVHEPQIHLGPLHCLIFALNSSRSFALLICKGTSFHILAPSYRKVWRPHLLVFTFGWFNASSPLREYVLPSGEKTFNKFWKNMKFTLIHFYSNYFYSGNVQRHLASLLQQIWKWRVIII